MKSEPGEVKLARFQRVSSLLRFGTQEGGRRLPPRRTNTCRRHDALRSRLPRPVQGQGPTRQCVRRVARLADQEQEAARGARHVYVPCVHAAASADGTPTPTPTPTSAHGGSSTSGSTSTTSSCTSAAASASAAAAAAARAPATGRAGPRPGDAGGFSCRRCCRRHAACRADAGVARREHR